MKTLVRFLVLLPFLGFAASANTIVFEAPLNGASEVPPTSSVATGFAIVTLDEVAQTLEVEVVFSGLQGPTTASHIHCCTTTPDVGNAGVATTTPTFTDFPLGVTSGSYDHIFSLTDASSYNPAFVAAEGGTVAGAESALLTGMIHGETYLNIHTTVDPGGEIRGYLAAVPEPSSLALAGACLLLFWIARPALAR